MNKSFWNGAHVAITGHTGFKGTWLTLMLEKLGAKVSGYSVPPPTNPSLYEIMQYEHPLSHALISYDTIGDVENMANLFHWLRTNKPDILFHLAADPIVKNSFDCPLNTFAINTMGTVNVLEAIRHLSVDNHIIKSVVVVTTDKVYKVQEEDALIKKLCFRESDELGGNDVYSASKSCVEVMVEAYRKSFYSELGINVATARAGNVLGGGDFQYTRIMPYLVYQLFHKKPIQLRNPQAIRPWNYVLDVLQGYILLAEKLYISDKYSEAWNFGPDVDDCSHTVQEIVDYVTSKIGGKELVTTVHAPYKETQVLALSSQKAIRDLKWKRLFTFKDALQAAVEWYQVYYDSKYSAMNVAKYTQNDLNYYMGHF